MEKGKENATDVVSVLEGILVENFLKLYPGSSNDGQVGADVLFDQVVDTLLDFDRRQITIDQRISAGDVSAHVCKAVLRQNFPQLGHGSSILTHRHDAAEQDDESVDVAHRFIKGAR